jgi:hypothetical protein
LATLKEWLVIRKKELREAKDLYNASQAIIKVKKKEIKLIEQFIEEDTLSEH